MKKPWVRYLLLGLGAYLVFLVGMFPADRGYGLVKGPLESGDFPIKLYGLEGSVWNGRASAAQIGPQRLYDVSWDVHTSALLTGATELEVGFRRDQDRAQMVVGRSLGGELYLDDVQAKLAVAELIKALGLPAVQLEGELHTNLQNVRFDGQALLAAEGTLGWFNAATRFPQHLALGDVSARFETTDEGVKATLADGGGPLELAGELLLKPDGQYKLEAALAARNGPQSPLGRSLNMLGRPDRSGKINVTQSGNLADFGFLLR